MKKVFMVVALIPCLVYSPFANDGTGHGYTLATTIPGIILVDIEPAASKNSPVVYSSPAGAGLVLTVPSDSALCLNYSSIKYAGSLACTVPVRADLAIAGFGLKVPVTAGAGNGGTAGGTFPIPDRSLIGWHVSLQPGLGKLAIRFRNLFLIKVQDECEKTKPRGKNKYGACNLFQAHCPGMVGICRRDLKSEVGLNNLPIL